MIRRWGNWIGKRIGVLLLVVGVVGSICAIALKTKREVERSSASLTASITTKTTDRWTGANRKTSDKYINEWNDGQEGRAYVLVPDASDIIAGRDPQPLPKTYPPSSRESATVRFSWASCEGVDVGLDRNGDGSDPFIDRAVASYRKLHAEVPSEK